MAQRNQLNKKKSQRFRPFARLRRSMSFRRRSLTEQQESTTEQAAAPKNPAHQALPASRRQQPRQSSMPNLQEYNVVSLSSYGCGLVEDDWLGGFLGQGYACRPHPEEASDESLQLDFSCLEKYGYREEEEKEDVTMKSHEDDEDEDQACQAEQQHQQQQQDQREESCPRMTSMDRLLRKSSGSLTRLLASPAIRSRKTCERQSSIGKASAQQQASLQLQRPAPQHHKSSPRRFRSRRRSMQSLV